MADELRKAARELLVFYDAWLSKSEYPPAPEMEALRAALAATEPGSPQGMLDTSTAKKQRLALENCRQLALRYDKKDWAHHILRFCADAGVTGSPLRTDPSREPTQEMVRDRFEAWITGPPHERDAIRYPKTADQAWPGSYRELDVDLAWQAWQDAYAAGYEAGSGT